jgi:hypothetical protein
MARASKNVVAVTPGGDITLDHIMGYYTLFTVPDEPVSASKLNRLWIAEGLPHDIIPNSRSAKNAFQVAARSIENRSRKTDSAKRRIEIEVDPVAEDADRVVYQVTKLARDSRNELIHHPKAMKLTFDKNTELMSWEPIDRLSDMDQSDLQGLFDLIQNHYDRNAKKVPGSRVRSGIRKLLKEIGAVNIRKRSGGSGVYFVPKEAKDYLDSLETVIGELYEADAAELHLIPTVSAAGQRELVERHFNANVSSELDELMAEVTEALKRVDPQSGGDDSGKRALRKDRVGNILAQRKFLGEHRERYVDLLGTSLEEMEVKLGLLDQQLEALVLRTNAD